MWTPEGLAHTLSTLAGEFDGGVVIVRDGEGDGAQQARASISSVTVDSDKLQLAVSATFPEDEANFDWRVRYVTTRSGVIVDRLVEDMGRKAPGAVWNVEAVLELAAEEG